VWRCVRPATTPQLIPAVFVAWSKKTKNHRRNPAQGTTSSHLCGERKKQLAPTRWPTTTSQQRNGLIHGRNSLTHRRSQGKINSQGGKLVQQKAVGKRTLEAIAKVHGDGSLLEIPVRWGQSRKENGSYKWYGRKPLEIVLSKHGSTHESFSRVGCAHRDVESVLPTGFNTTELVGAAHPTPLAGR